ncbi:hypothetical protein INT43_006640, partial [Umbelopsis isabellina]
GLVSHIMAAAIATTPRQNSVSTPASLSSPTFTQHNSPQMPAPHPHRKEVVCVFVVEGTAKMQPYFSTLFEAYLEPLLRQLRAPIITEADDKQPKTKVTPILKYGLVIYGDYEPSSAVTVDRKYFTSDFSLFHSVFKNINCSQGGILKNAVFEGLVAALELFDDYKANADASLSDPIFHCILVAASLPYNMSVRCNVSEKYDQFRLPEIVEEMRKNNVQLSLVAPRKGLHELEKLSGLVNNKKTEINKILDTVNPAHVVQLAGLKLPTPQITPAPTPPTTDVASVNIMPLIGNDLFDIGNVIADTLINASFLF